MDTIMIDKTGYRTKMIAHRGCSGLERENTNAAFVAAGQRSYYGIETDIHVTADGKFILFHDDDLKRLCGIDKTVEACTFDELRQIRLTDIDGRTVRGDLCLPTLEEYISICKKYDKQAILELKNPMPKDKVYEIVKTIEDMGWYARTTFISFDGGNLVAIREKYADADIQYLSETCTEKEIAFMAEHNFDADLCGYCVTPKAVKALRSRGIKINVWTVDLPEHWELAKNFDLDFLTTNILE